MNLETLREEFKGQVSEKIDLEPEGVDRFLVLTPFRFEDGDHFNVVLKREGDGWILTDEASTLMHLSYWLDDKALESGNRKEIVDNSLAYFSVQNRNGEILMPVIENRFGDALFNFIQALTKVTDVSFLSREIVRSTFMEDFKNFLRKNVAEERLQFDWTAREDTKSHYKVDCRINGMSRPLLVFGLPNDDKVKDATISLLKFEQWNMRFQSLGIFEEQESIPPKSVARFGDTVEKSFSNLEGNKDRIINHIKRILDSA